MSETTISTTDGTLNAYVAQPASGAGAAVLVIQEIFGINQGRSQWVDATLYLERRDGVYADDAKKWSRVQFGREDGALGPLATRGVVEGDWSGVW